MPFTLSHPAAVIPLRRLGVFSALVIGSMIPDSIYFLPFVNEHDRYGHTLPGFFFYCLPAGIILLWLFHHFMKRPLIALFPEDQQPKLIAASPDFPFTPFKRFAWIVFSLMLGAFTHILWDSVTHADTYLFSTGDWLSETVHTGGTRLQIADVLQLSSSLLGMIAIVICYWLWLRRTPIVQSREPSLSRAGRIAVFAIFAASAPVPFMARLLLDPELWFRSKRRTLTSFGVVNGIKLMCAELVIYCIVWHLVFRRRERAVSPVSHSY